MSAKYAALVGLTTSALMAITDVSVAQSAVEKARQARTMWSAFQCGIYAEMSGERQEQARLFVVGIKAGRDFIDAINKNQIPPEVAKREVPIGVNLVFGGPTPDFILGRIFESASNDAFDDVVKKDNGIALENSKWIMDSELRKAKAKTQYLKGNCVIVK
ncbi:MAG: hypothetical protein Q7T45_27055 [Bradyrhizobium sp.]|uniref:hypothetical protein n=1 Tax=Bradyrhizobium sp. TaxID=376 RepID=UPI002727DD06|nr:hypothetical protein [Bradyrhizobium sp.]MDO8401471.1 hypothetical protein [Bradyrhizobium sp.]